jgi:hypothetical protein
MKFAKLLLVICLSIPLFAQSPYILTGVKSYYPVVEINSDNIDMKYKALIKEMIVEKSTELGISTQNFSTRSLAVLINYISVGDTLALKVSLMLAEDAMRLDTKEEVFVLSYVDTKIFVVTDLEEELPDTIEDMLDTFGEQYKEDNE